MFCEFWEKKHLKGAHVCLIRCALLNVFSPKIHQNLTFFAKPKVAGETIDNIKQMVFAKQYRGY